MIAPEIVKHRLNRGLDRALYTFRDRQGLEVDFVLDNGNRRLTLIEAKATRTPMPGGVPAGAPACVRPGVTLTDPDRLHAHLSGA